MYLTFIPKYAIILNRLPRGQKKRFYFNVLKNGKKQIIKREKNRKKVYVYERANVHAK